MKTPTYSIFLTIALLCTSCAFNVNFPDKIKGEGEVISEQIVLDAFSSLKLSRGWEVTLIPSTSNYMVVEANENLFEVLEFDNQSGKLDIGSKKQISSANAKSITLYFTERLETLKVSSGTVLKSEDRLNFENLVLDISSGAEVYLDVDLKTLQLETSSGSEAVLSLNVEDLFIDSSSGSSALVETEAISIDVEASSGSEVTLRGTAHQLDVKTSSGAEVHSKGLESKSVVAKASSGSSISVYPMEDLKAEVSSGGDVYYHHQPSGSIDMNKSKSGGSIKQK